jgi:hypothetical protein
MNPFFAPITKRWETGEFHDRLDAYVLSWRDHLSSDYVVVRAADQAAAHQRTEDLYELLMDEEFRRRRRELGTSGLRADLRVGREYFSGGQPDLLRFLQLLFLEQGAGDSPGTLAAHKANCAAYEEFLQIDLLPEERPYRGLRRALSKFFPDPPNDGPFRLLGFEVGDWRCSCGARTGLAERYTHRCPCGALSGGGRLPAMPPECSRCRQPVRYRVCQNCRTRVTLKTVWQMRQGGSHPSIYSAPLYVDLRFNGADIRVPLIQLPLPLGLTEHPNGTVGFNLPDAFWLHHFAGANDPRVPNTNIVVLDASLTYDRQTEPCTIFEAMFRRSLCQNRSGYKAFTYELMEALTRGRTPAGAGLVRRNTRRFENRIGYNIADSDWRPENLVRFLDVETEYRVAIGPGLRRDMALLSRERARAADLSVPHLINVRTSLGAEDVLTGLVAPGSLVRSGETLVGVKRIPTWEQLSPEERLLQAIFGPKADPGRVDDSLTLHGHRVARVLAQRVELGDHSVDEAPGRSIEARSSFFRQSRTTITITLAVEQGLESGDSLLGEHGTAAVICGVRGGQVLRALAGTSVQPDLLVASDHPWAPERGSVHTLSLRLKKDDLTARETTARAADSLVRLSLQPPAVDKDDKKVAWVQEEDIVWLAAMGARALALELCGPRSDFPGERKALWRRLSGEPVKDDQPIDTWTNLTLSPAEVIRRFAKVLWSARILATLDGDALCFAPISDEEIGTSSKGLVSVPYELAGPTGEPAAGGLFSKETFYEPYTGQLSRSRMGHIDLNEPIVHSWYLQGKAREWLAGRLGLTDEQLRELSETNAALAERIARCPELPLDHLLIRRLPVLPLGLRPRITLDDGSIATSDLNRLYAEVVSAENSLRKLISRSGPHDSIAPARRKLQIAVDRLLDNARTVHPRVDDFGRRLVSLSDSLLPSELERPGYRAHLLKRRVDYSARTRLVAAEVPDLDTALVPADLARTMFRPLIHANGDGAQGEDPLRTACRHAMIAVSLPSGPWRMVGFRVALHDELALKVHSKVMEKIGWDSNQGAVINMFAVMSEETIRETERVLTPSRLRTTGAKQLPAPSERSLFDLPDQSTLLDELALAAVTGARFPLGELDYLLLGMRQQL